MRQTSCRPLARPVWRMCSSRRSTPMLARSSCSGGRMTPAARGWSSRGVRRGRRAISGTPVGAPGVRGNDTQGR
eukprot:2524463-Alexandrium_andersonii.AAC.1